ncbi:ADP-ribosyltransferase [Mycobacterium sp. SMC-16]|uniref:VG15 protein n=1 Tax=Mycobacterium sp. SMC-16 TaxID=3385967 RepID=UPI00390C4674
MPPVAVPEFQDLLTGLSNDLGQQIDKLGVAVGRLDQRELLSFVTDAYPQLITPYLAGASTLTTTWYDEQPAAPLATGAAPFIAEPAELAPIDQLAISARWAMLQANPLTQLRRTGTRAVFTASRDTVVANAAREGIRWARHASANACGFCRMLATRGAVYRSQELAQKAHDGCHCLAVPDRDGLYVPAPYVAQWLDDYNQARGDGARAPAQIANAMDKAAGGRRAPVGSRPAQNRADSSKTSGRAGTPPIPPIPPMRGGLGQPSGPDPKWLKQSRAHISGLTGRYRQSVIGYTGKDHERINGWLRRDNAKPDPWTAARIKDLDAVLGANPLPGFTALTRTVDVDAFGITRGDDLAKIAGVQRIEHGYISTTRHSGGGTTKDYKTPVRLTVMAPAGTPAAAIEDVSKFPGQGEVLLGRGLEYTIVNPAYDEQLGMWRATMLIKREVGTR